MPLPYVVRGAIGLLSLGCAAKYMGLISHAWPALEPDVVVTEAGDRPIVQTSMYQAQASFSDSGFPALPSGNGGAPAASALPDLSGLPAASTAGPPPMVMPGTSDGGVGLPGLPPSGVDGSAGGLLPEPTSMPMVSPASSQALSGARGLPSSARGPSNAPPPAMNNGLPPSRTSAPQQPPQSAPSRAATNTIPGRTIGFQNQGNLRQVGQSEDLRAINDRNGLRSAANQSNLGRGTGNVATGLPYVTPAPRSRYATSPYNQALFMNAAYNRQRAVTPAPSTVAGGGVTGSLASAQTRLANASMAQPYIYPTAYQCNPVLPQYAQAPTLPPTYPQAGAVPGSAIPPTVTPNLAPGLYASDNSGYSPIFSLGQEGYNVQIGRGIIGQPTVYVPGQPVRNFLRYLSP